jgi:hypothetical protein
MAGKRTFADWRDRRLSFPGLRSCLVKVIYRQFTSSLLLDYIEFMRVN